MMARYHFIAFLTSFIWGFTFVSSKVLLQTFTPTEIVLIRFILGFLALLAFGPHRLRLLDVNHELLFAAAGLTGVTMYFMLENTGLVYTSASNISIIVATAPLLTAILVMVVYREQTLTARFVTGFVLAILGIALISIEPGQGFSLKSLGDLIALLSALVWAIYSTIVIKISSLGYDTIPATRRIFVWGIVFMIPAVLFSGFDVDMTDILEPANLANLLFLGLLASSACYIMWNLAVARIGATKTSVYIYLQPVITVIFAAIILGEPITMRITAGMALTIAGLVLSQWRSPRPGAVRVDAVDGADRRERLP